MPVENHKADNQRDQGILSVVATPIGNLGDITERALQTLINADLVLAEDTRHSQTLFRHFGISTPLLACHEHNEKSLVERVINRLQRGENLALVSDAGTPLISDPGFVLVRALREHGIRIEVVPGVSSVTAALSIAGLPTDRFIYDGFLPAKVAARQVALEAYMLETRTVVLLESTHRIVACLNDVAIILGAGRQVVLARELTKKFETVLSGTAEQVAQMLVGDANQTRGEFVLLLGGVETEHLSAQGERELVKCLYVLLGELPLKQAASLAAKICSTNKNAAYRLALNMRDANA